MRVLVATDGSDAAQRAAEFLARLPHREPLDIAVLTVVPSLEIHGSKEVVDWMQRNAQSVERQARESCARIESVFEGADARVESVVARGAPGNTIVEEAKNRAVDLVVLGAAGHSLIERALLGSVCDFVAIHVACSVLVIRPPMPDKRDNEKLRLCVAFDGSEASKSAIADLDKFQWGNRTHLDIVNVIVRPFIYSEIPLDVDLGPAKAAMENQLKQVAEETRGHFPDLATHVLETDHVGDGIVQFTTTNSTDLLVVGDTGHGTVARLLLGSVSRFALHHSGCSVWIARCTNR